jgi:ketosteroid isomerase-like protein
VKALADSKSSKMASSIVAADSGTIEKIEQLDIDYQSAVARNDAATMNRILADDFILTTGTGKVFAKADLLEEARSQRITYERQDDSERKVRVWGDTAVVTALLWAKGKEDGKPFEYRVWFSDTYAQINGSWRYVVGQSGARLPP